MRLSVCLGCGTVFLFKKVDKVVGVFVARLQSDFVYLFLGGEQQVFCGFHPFFIEVFERRQAESGGKFVADPVFAHMTALLQIVEPDVACQMIVYIMPELSQIGSAGLLFAFQMKRTDKEICQNGGYQIGIPQFIFRCGAGAAGEKLFQIFPNRRKPVNAGEEKGMKGNQRLVNVKKPPPPSEKAIMRRG